MEKLSSLTAPLSLTQVLFFTGVSLFIYILVWGLVGIYKKRGDLADLAWGPGFLLVAWVSFLLSPFSIYSFLIDLLVTAWGLRLASHIYLRNRNRPEDFRYQNLKKKWGKQTSLWMFFQVYFLQGVLLYIISLPILWINIHSRELSAPLFLLAIPLWLGGFLLETLSDAQLAAFRKNPSNRGKLLKTGLWSYVRHPNYLGEIAQWWAFWIPTLILPYGWLLSISPILITFLIIKVSGIAPLEEKMKRLPEYSDYSKTTPSLIPFPLLNSAVYLAAWYLLVSFGAKEDPFLSTGAVFLFAFALQIYLYIKLDPNNFLISIPLSIYALLLGLLQETLFIHFGVLRYPNGGIFPPFWLLSIYPLFALTLNPSLGFLNRKLFLAFCFGGLGALFSYISGEKLGAVYFVSPLFYLWISLSWGIYLTLLILLNRKLIQVRDRFVDPEKLKTPVTVFFDDRCPICYREMTWLKKRKQTGSIEYACPHSDEDLRSVSFSYKEAMETIHAIDAKGELLQGTDVLSELYARVDLPILSVFLQAPLFRPLFRLAYAIWARLRSRSA